MATPLTLDPWQPRPTHQRQADPAQVTTLGVVVSGLPAYHLSAFADELRRIETKRGERRNTSFAPLPFSLPCSRSRRTSAAIGLVHQTRVLRSHTTPSNHLPGHHRRLHRRVPVHLPQMRPQVAAPTERSRALRTPRTNVPQMNPTHNAPLSLRTTVTPPATPRIRSYPVSSSGLDQRGRPCRPFPRHSRTAAAS
jgi:hypothetical protein